MIRGKLKEMAAALIISLFQLLPVRKNKIIMFSYYGSNYGCNPKYLTDYISEHAPMEFDIVWAFHHPDSKQTAASVRKVKMMSLKYFYEVSTAKVIITNYRTTNFFKKRKNQYYIQTWHSSLRLKQIEKDAIDSLPEGYIKMAQKDAAKCDLLLSGCKYSTEIFKRSFWYDGEIFEYGTPRNDLLFQRDESKRQRIMKKLHVSPDKKILLYAPTFRKNNHQTTYDLDYKQLSKVLENKSDKDWVILVKLHPHLLAEAKELLPVDVQNVTSFDDIQELLFVADMLITDYSSLMFDFAITKKPCFLYVPDLKAYTAEDRKLYFHLNELPFIHAQRNEELFNAIDNYNADNYIQDVEEFLRKVNSYEEGQACKMLVQRIKAVCHRQKGSEMIEAI